MGEVKETHQVRPSDANVDDVLDALAGEALPVALDHAVRELFHVSLEEKHHYKRVLALHHHHFHHYQDSIDCRHDIVAVHRDLHVGPVPECHVQHRAVLGEVDLVAREHGLAGGIDLAGTGLEGKKESLLEVMARASLR